MAKAFVSGAPAAPATLVRKTSTNRDGMTPAQTIQRLENAGIGPAGPKPKKTAPKAKTKKAATSTPMTRQVRKLEEQTAMY